MCDDDDGWENYESGPFCEHWAEPGDCDEMCVCGHTCGEHEFYSDEHECRRCDCKGFTEKE